MKRNCFNCAMCSEHFPSFKDLCDVDNHEIKNVEKESCKEFVGNDDNAEMENEWARSGY